ncbi:hypothetical protein E2C01_056742 [Portunus trituberculatus]|uniref:Uncharacterized protein n=1 Tax=Portunus trituberculatus TaxID=210409 RepID=A0A5B7GY94_PORTR|nr:hypothetical protein [Portunus trituberculatus]
MSWLPSVAGHSPDIERPTGMKRSSSNVKDLHKGSRHGKDHSRSRSCSNLHERLILDKESHFQEERKSFSQSPSPSQASTGEDSSAFTLALIMDAIAAFRSDMDKLKKESKAVSTNEVQHAVFLPLSSTNLASVSQMVHVSQASPVGFSGFRSNNLLVCLMVFWKDLVSLQNL